MPWSPFLKYGATKHTSYSFHTAFPLGSKKCREHRPTVLLWPKTLCGNIQLQPTKDWAFPPALLTGEYQRPQKHVAQRGQVTKLFADWTWCIYSWLSAQSRSVFVTSSTIYLQVFDHERMIVIVIYTPGADLVLSFLGFNRRDQDTPGLYMGLCLH